MNDFGISTDAANSVHSIHGLTKWLIKNEFMDSVKRFYNKTFPYSRASELVAFMAGQLYGAHMVWNSITGESYDADQLKECSEFIAWMTETYEPENAWKRRFRLRLDDLITTLELLALKGDEYHMTKNQFFTAEE